MTQKKDYSQQIRFFERIKDIIPPALTLVNEVADVLEISIDSAYRRIRGETPLSIDELSLLTSHFKIGFDLYSEKDGSVTFNYNQMHGIEGFQIYLQDIYNELLSLAATPQSELYYAAMDIPIFHHFKHAELSAFKMFYWLKDVLNEPTLDSMKFSEALVPESLKKLGVEIYNAYCNVPGVEIWTGATINSSLAQIEFYWESGLIEKKEFALLLIEQLEDVLKTIQKQAEQSCKVIPNLHQIENYKLYYSDIEIGNNCILTQKNGIKAVYLSFHTFNKLSTYNTHFCENTLRWLNNLIRKSTLISGVSEKQRHIFFKRVYDNIEKLKDKIGKPI